MSVITELKEITNLVREKDRDMVNHVVSSNFKAEEQMEIVELFRDLLVDELIHAMALMKVEREKEQMIRGIIKD